MFFVVFVVLSCVWLFFELSFELLLLFLSCLLVVVFVFLVVLSCCLLFLYLLFVAWMGVEGCLGIIRMGAKSISRQLTKT